MAQTVIVAPVLLLTIMLIVQVGLMFHARNVAENAAQIGAATARSFDGTQAAAASRVNTYLAGAAGSALVDESVSVTRTPDLATVTVSGTVAVLVPGLSLDVEESASGPVERYVPLPTQGGTP